jgi:hypothetical protein
MDVQKRQNEKGKAPIKRVDKSFHYARANIKLTLVNSVRTFTS